MKISFIITNNNYSKYLEQSIDSCIHQNEKTHNYEIIVLDDGSNDISRDILIKEKFKNCKIIMIPNSGLEYGLNLCLKIADGEFICRLDSDDVLAENSIEFVSKFLDKYDVIYGNYRQLNANGEEIGEFILPQFDKSEIISRGDFLASGTYIRKDILIKHGGYPSKKKNCGLENYEIILKILMNNYTFKKIDKSLFFFRIHNVSMSSKKKYEIIKYGELIFNDLNLGSYNIGKFHPRRDFFNV